MGGLGEKEVGGIEKKLCVKRIAFVSFEGFPPCLLFSFPSPLSPWRELSRAHWGSQIRASSSSTPRVGLAWCSQVSQRDSR